MALTADSSLHAENRARRAGAVDFLAKPVDLPVLLDRCAFERN